MPAAEAMQPGAAVETGQGGKVEAAGAEGDLPPVHHKAMPPVHSEGNAVTGDTTGSCWQGDLVGG